jgi:hypothetical protein
MSAGVVKTQYIYCVALTRRTTRIVRARLPLPGKEDSSMTATRRFVPAILALLAAGLSPACAEIRVSGAPEAVRLEARDATVGEALAALGETVGGLKFRNSPALNRRFSGVYAGSLERVVSRLLEGNNFIIKRSPDGMEVIVLSDSGAMVPGGPAGIAGVPVPGAGADIPRPPWLKGYTGPPLTPPR